MSVRQIFQNYNFFYCLSAKKSPSCHYIFFIKNRIFTAFAGSPSSTCRAIL